MLAVEFGLCDGAEDGEFNGVCLAEISNMCAVTGSLFLFGTELVDKIYFPPCLHTSWYKGKKTLLLQISVTFHLFGLVYGFHSPCSLMKSLC